MARCVAINSDGDPGTCKMLATARCTLRRANCGCLGPLAPSPQIAARAFAGNPKQKGKLNKKQQAKADQKAASQYLDVFARAVDSHGAPTSLSEEEQAANWEIVKEYQRGLSRRHNKQRRELLARWVICRGLPLVGRNNVARGLQPSVSRVGLPPPRRGPPQPHGG